MTDCIFCKIIKGEIPSHKIYEDEHVFAFLDINPVSEGHTLIVPKKHILRFADANDEDITKLFEGVKKVAKKIENISNNYNLGINQGKLAGQVVDHLHVHIIPRYEDDGINMWPGKKLNDDMAKELLEKLK